MLYYRLVKGFKLQIRYWKKIFIDYHYIGYISSSVAILVNDDKDVKTYMR